MGEFVIRNPAPPPARADWKIEPLPVMQKVGEVSFTFAALKIHRGPVSNDSSGISDREILPEFKASEEGQPSKKWQPVWMELYDVSGNCAVGQLDRAGGELDTELCLCPREAGWKLRVQFCGTEWNRA